MILDGHLPASIAAAARALRSGALLGLPTETVYGLAADADNDAAVAQIFAAKGRPSDHPLIVHVADASAIAHFASAVPVFAQALVDAFWPGPLTLILPRRPDRARAATGGQDSVGLRCPAHPVAHAVLQACAQGGSALDGAPVRGVAAPSANRFGRVSPTTAAHVQAELGDALLVLDGGPCAVGIESTIVDCTRGAPVLLRPGQLGRADIERVAGRPLLSKEELLTPDPQAPGTLLAHYAPRARLRLMDARELRAALRVLGADARHIAVWTRAPLHSDSRQLLLRRMPESADAAARELFALLRDFDAAGARLIWVETPPADPAWDGVRDRLQRAAASG